MIKELGLNREEANKLYYRIRLQHVANEIQISSDFSLDSNESRVLENYLVSEIDPDTGYVYENKKIQDILTDIDKNKQNSKYYYLWMNCQELINNIRGRTNNKSDFTHQMITTATIQNKDDKLKGNILCDKVSISIPDYTNDGTWDDESGWFGDIFGISLYDTVLIPPSMSFSDYKSDLDAYNILSLQHQLSINGNRVSYDEASRIYYNDISSGEINRASYFMENNPSVFSDIFDQSYKNYFESKYGNAPQDYPPTFFPSPEATKEYNDTIEEQRRLYKEKRVEFDILSEEEKLNYLPQEAKNFYLSLKNNNNDYKEY